MSDPAAPAASATAPGRDLALSLLLVGLWTGYTILRQWGHWPEDLAALYVAGWLWQTAQPELIYAAPAGFFGGGPADWRPALEALGIAAKGAFPYVYPPLWAVLTAPLTGLLTPQGFADAVTLLQIPMLGASVLLAGRLMKPATMPLWLWSAIGIAILSFSIQSWVAVWYNQPTITVTFLTLLAFERLGANRPVSAGAALALAAALKLSPAVLVLLFLIDRQYRAAAAFAVTGTALGLLSIALAGWPLHAEFLGRLSDVSGAGFLIAINVSLKPALLAAGSALSLMEPVDPTATEHIYRATPAWLGPALSLAALALAATFLRRLAPLPGPARRGIGLLAFSIILTLFGPLGWLHYYLLPLLLLPGLIGLLPAPRAGVLLLWVGLPSLSLVFARIGILPWPIANYVWLMSAAWLAVLAALWTAAGRKSV